MPRIGSFGPSIRIKYKLELNQCNSSSRKQARFRGNQIHLPSRHLDVLTVYSSCKLKTRQDERQGIKLPLETIAFYSDSFVPRKINVEQKVAENWAPYCRPFFKNGGWNWVGFKSYNRFVLGDYHREAWVLIELEILQVYLFTGKTCFMTLR